MNATSKINSVTDLTVVLLSYNTKDLMEQALRTVAEASTELAVEVFVVDNASWDGSADMVAEKFPEVNLIRNEENVGFAAGNNVALRQVSGRHVLLLNTDTVVRRDTLQTLVRFLDENPEAGAVGCKILNPDGTLQPDCMRGFPTPMAAFCKVSGLSRLFPNSPRFARYNMTFLDPQQTHQVEVLSGSCMMVRTETMNQVGMLDEDYFMYGEDIDWCFRMHLAGWKLYYVPDTEIIHFRGESGRAVPMRVLYRKTEAMSIFVKKHMGRRYRFFPLWLLNVGIAMHGFYSLLRHFGKRFALPVLDAVLILLGLELGLALRYHEKLGPLMQAIEATSQGMGFQVEPSRWLVPPDYSDLQWFLVYAVPLATWLLGFQLLELYDRHRYSIYRSVVAVAVGFAVVVTLVFFFKGYNFSRLAAGAAWAFCTVLMAGWRLIARWYIHSRRGPYRRRILLIGTDEEALTFMRYLQELGGIDYYVVGLVGTVQSERGRLVGGHQVVGLADELTALVAQYEIDELIFATGTMATARQQTAAVDGRVRVRRVPPSFALLLGDWTPASADELPLLDIARGWPNPNSQSGSGRPWSF